MQVRGACDHQGGGVKAHEPAGPVTGNRDTCGGYSRQASGATARRDWPIQAPLRKDCGGPHQGTVAFLLPAMSDIAPQAIAPHGPGGLLSAPGLGGSRRQRRLARKAAARIATKPGTKYRSIQNPRMYRALRREGHSKEAAARISNARSPGHTVKANYGAKKGETIAGNLVRGDDGKFASAGSPSKAPKPKGKKGRAAKPADPAKEAQRQADREYQLLRRQQIQQDRQERLARQAKREAERREDRDQRARDRAERRAEVERRRAEREAARKKREEERAKKGGGGGGKKGDDKDAAAADKLDQQLAELRRLAGAFGRKAEEPTSFTVFKDARGQYRWVALSSNAYQDRDGEIVSTKALADDVARADADGSYGPLRWWHCGEPDPLNPVAPWGPGIDLGTCDFNAMAGRVLLESGTFASPEIGERIAAKADDLGISIGFIHPPNEPDAQGVFHHIRRFERSLAPRERVSNPFTTLTVIKETAMDEIKKAALKALGFTDAQIAGYEAQAQLTEKAAQDQGVRFKEADPPATPAATEPPAEIVIGGVTYAVKAPPAPPAAVPAPAVAAPAEEKAPEDELIVEEGPDEMMLTPGEMDAIADRVAERLAPLMGIEAKMGKMMDEFKTSIAGYGGAMSKKDAEIADIKAEQAKLAERLKTLEGDQPEVTSNRASQSIEAALIAQSLKANGGVQPTAPPLTPEGSILDWLAAGGTPTP